MPSNPQTLDYNELELFFRAHRDTQAQDVAFTASPGVDALIASSINVRRDFRATSKKLKFKASRMTQTGRMISGALHYESPTILTKLSGLVKSSGAGVQTVDNTPSDESTVARWALSEYYQPVGISTAKWRAATSGGSMKAKAAGALSLIKQKTTSAYQAVVEGVAGDLFGTNTAPGSGILSMSAGIGNSATDTTTYGQISRSTYNVWRGNYTSRTAGDIDDTELVAYILRSMQADVQTVMINGASVKNLMFMMAPNLYTQVWNAYMGFHDGGGPQIVGRFNINNGSGIPDFGGEGMAFGNIPILMDPHIPSNKCILLDTETSYFVGLKGSVFDMEPWNLSENTTAQFSRVVFMGQFVVTNPRRNAITVWA